MRRVCLCVLWLSLAGLPVACGGAATSNAPSASATSGDEVALAEAASCESGDARDRRARELEARLATSTAEVRTLRTQLRAAQDHEGATQAAASTDVTTLPADDADEEPSGARPVLRLYGAPSMTEVAVLAGPAAPSSVAAPPLGLFTRLPVVLTPGAPDAVPAIPMEPITVAPAAAPIEDGVVIEYRAALAHVSAREWDAALSSLARFVTAHPDHAYADNAMYWRGEVLYARRDYAAAIAELTSMIERFPSGNKVPDALLRIGFAYQRLGESERAREIFRRVREQYPGTVAARTASREDA